MNKTYKHISYEKLPTGILELKLDMKGKSVNVLNSELVTELTDFFQELAQEKDVRGLLIASKKPRQFIAGADIEEIFGLTDPSIAMQKAQLGQRMMNLLENLPFPTLSIIDGPTLGGGMEFALSTTYRVAGEGSHVKLALPEVQLGIIPGWGGTQRLPHLIGFTQALTLITTGKSISSVQALKLGLVDDVAPTAILHEVGLNLLLKKPRLSSPRKLSGIQKFLQSTPPYRSLILSIAKKKILKETSGFYPAPLAALEVLGRTFPKRSAANDEMEAKHVGQLIVSHVSKSLVGLFQGTEEIRKSKSSDAAKHEHVGVLGAGVMGGGIANLLASKEKNVRIKDISTQSLLKALQTSSDLVKKNYQRKKITKAQANAIAYRISPSTTYAGFEKVDFVIEAVVENMEIKKQVLSEVSNIVAKSTVLATNTSALSISEMAKAVQHPERVVGLHFFNPVHRMPLIEVVKGEQTSPETVAQAVHMAIALGKTPIVVADRPGFLVNRILGLYLNEAMLMLQEGHNINNIEKAMKKFGMPMGPFELMDEIGLDVGAKVGHYLSDALSHFPKTAALFDRISASKRLGKKGGLGFYDHKSRPKKIDATFLQSLGIRTSPATVQQDILEEISDRLVLLMVNEACRCLEDRVANSERDVDLAMVLGTGFAPFRGGLFAHARRVGLGQVNEKLTALAAKHGNHFAPCRALFE